MENKKLNSKKLTLKKSVISQLNDANMSEIKGGNMAPDPYTRKPRCKTIEVYNGLCLE